MQTLRIDEELKALIPPLRESEYSQLEENILSEGIREPIIVWNGTIIDGHNRYAIAQKHGLDFTVKEMQFDSKDAVISWMIYNQFGRRNLSIYDSVCLALKLKPRIEADAKKRKLATQNNNAAKNLQGAEVQNFVPLGSGKTIDKIAALAGVSRETVRKVEKINELAIHLRADDIIDRLRKGEISISLALEAIQMKREKLDTITDEIKMLTDYFRVSHQEFYQFLWEIVIECAITILPKQKFDGDKIKVIIDPTDELATNKLSKIVGEAMYKSTDDEYFNPETFNVFKWIEMQKQIAENLGITVDFDVQKFIDKVATIGIDAIITQREEKNKQLQEWYEKIQSKLKVSSIKSLDWA